MDKLRKKLQEKIKGTTLLTAEQKRNCLNLSENPVLCESTARAVIREIDLSEREFEANRRRAKLLREKREQADRADQENLSKITAKATEADILGI